jgi:hypothetical protein
VQTAPSGGCVNERPDTRGAPSDRLPSPCKLPFLEKKISLTIFCCGMPQLVHITLKHNFEL